MYSITSTNEWETIIGIEVHAQIIANSKIFSDSSTTLLSNNFPNSSVSLFDAAIPGVLPILNEYCVLQAVKTSLALNANINLYSAFDRKHYFYPDLPQGYQITQFYFPIAEHGYIMIPNKEGYKKIKINRVHLEQDAGKSIHDKDDYFSFIDLNRCGVGLMEIVTDPDMRSADEAVEYIKNLRTILKYLGTCDCDMENGSLRCDINVSVRKVGDNRLGTRCEVKNVNSIKNIFKAIEFESRRQIMLLEDNMSVEQHTMLFDENKCETLIMRSKEYANDYRYLPDPDLPHLIITENLISSLKADLPELHYTKLNRYVKDHSLYPNDAALIVEDIFVAKYFEDAIQYANPKLVCNWLITELFGYLNINNIGINDIKITPYMLGKMISLIENSIISGKIAKTVFNIMANTGGDPEEIVKTNNLFQISDIDEINDAIDLVFKNNFNCILEYRNGKVKLFQYLVGQVIKNTKGKANPQIVSNLLKKRL